jgi:hypothetical protein
LLKNIFVIVCRGVLLKFANDYPVWFLGFSAAKHSVLPKLLGWRFWLLFGLGARAELLPHGLSSFELFKFALFVVVERLVEVKHDCCLLDWLFDGYEVFLFRLFLLWGLNCTERLSVPP